MAGTSVDPELLDKPLDTHVFLFDPFRIKVTKYHILASNCDRGAEKSCGAETRLRGICKVKSFHNNRGHFTFLGCGLVMATVYFDVCCYLAT